jgi:hypothetical protein
MSIRGGSIGSDSIVVVVVVVVGGLVGLLHVSHDSRIKIIARNITILGFKNPSHIESAFRLV